MTGDDAASPGRLCAVWRDRRCPNASRQQHQYDLREGVCAADILLRRLDKHKGFGFVEYEDAVDARAALDNMDRAELFGKVFFFFGRVPLCADCSNSLPPIPPPTPQKGHQSQSVATAPRREQSQ